jgi:polyketide cyclase/dehydrase/lipid transport protein
VSAVASWSSRTVIRAQPARVLDTLTDPDACARWSPVAFSLDDGGSHRLRAGTTCRVSGKLFGAPVRFRLDTLAADVRGLRLHAHGPIDLRVHYSLTPIALGCAVDAHVSVHPSRGHLGRLIAHATGTLLAAGTLDDALERMAHEAERPARRATRGTR